MLQINNERDPLIKIVLFEELSELSVLNIENNIEIRVDKFTNFETFIHTNRELIANLVIKNLLDLFYLDNLKGRLLVYDNKLDACKIYFKA